VLVNNAAIAFKSSDPIPFHDKAKRALDVNFRGTVDLTEELLPLLRKGHDARIVNVATNYLQQIKSKELQDQFTDPTLTMDNLQLLVNKFEQDAQSDMYSENGWGSSPYGPYGISKLALVAATKVWARQETGIKVNCFNPGFCKTDLTSNNEQGRPPNDGAKTGVWLATMKDCNTGDFFQDMQLSDW
jgi:NAD(P)-dependent dehydrogenase (short-subunit alcohol dehydrogenase family)